MVKQDTLGVPTKCTFPGCPKLLSSKYNLKRHIDYCHRGVRPHECSICFKRFSSKQNKAEHIRMEHSYSINMQESFKNCEIDQVEVNIPELSKLVMKSIDPDLRPFAKVERIYLFPEESEDLLLPLVKTDGEMSVVLPKFDDGDDNFI